MDGLTSHLRVASYNARGDGRDSYILKDNGGFHRVSRKPYIRTAIPHDVISKPYV